MNRLAVKFTSGAALALLAAFTISGCTPVTVAPSVTPIPPTVAPTVTPFVGPTRPRDVLPTLTPSETAKPVTAAPTTAGATAAPATAAPTTAPIVPTVVATVPAGPTSTSALLAMTLPPSITPPPAQSGISKGVPPALDMTLPEGWQAGYYVVPVRQPLYEVSINLARYYGPVKGGGQGTILVIWGYPSLGAPPTATLPGPTQTYPPNVIPLDYTGQLLWSDGVRMLQGTVVDIMCNVGRYEQRYFQIGGQNAIGAYFNVDQCPSEPATVGWFAGINQYGNNYLFYMYVEPISAYNEGRGDVQKILDTVKFRAPNTPTPAK